MDECRICYDSHSIINDRLIRPCRCSGSQSYIHEKCLKSLRFNTGNPNHIIRCPTCNYKYRFHKAWLAYILINPIFIVFSSLIFIFSYSFLISIFMYKFSSSTFGKGLVKELIKSTINTLGMIFGTIGAIAIIIFVISNGGSNTRIPEFNNRDFEAFGYLSAIIGFFVYIYYSFKIIYPFMEIQMKDLGEKILEVEV